MDWIVPALIVVASLALFWISIAWHEGKIFAAEHFVEVARGLVTMKAGALAQILEADEQLSLTFRDSRVLRTRDGMVVAYTITRHTEAFVHHYSISLIRHTRPIAVGETFTLYIARILGIAPELLTVAVSSAGVHHAQFVLTPDGEAEFETWPVTVPTPEQARQIHKECQQIRAAAEK